MNNTFIHRKAHLVDGQHWAVFNDTTPICVDKMLLVSLHIAFVSPSLPSFLTSICALSPPPHSPYPVPSLPRSIPSFSCRQLMLACQQYSYFSGESCCSYRSVCAFVCDFVCQKESICVYVFVSEGPYTCCL